MGHTKKIFKKIKYDFLAVLLDSSLDIEVCCSFTKFPGKNIQLEVDHRKAVTRMSKGSFCDLVTETKQKTKETLEGAGSLCL